MPVNKKAFYINFLNCIGQTVSANIYVSLLKAARGIEAQETLII